MALLDPIENKLSDEELVLLNEMADKVRSWVPEVLDGTSYGMPALIYKDKPLIGFGVTDGKLMLYPFSPNILGKIEGELSDFELSPGALRFSVDNQLTDDQLKLIIDTRLEQIERP